MARTTDCTKCEETTVSEQPLKHLRDAGVEEWLSKLSLEGSAEDQDANWPTSKLLSLPPELRNYIYSYALPDKPQEFRFMYGQYAPVPGLLHVSRKLRSEALGIYYGTSTFDFILHYRCTQPFKDWIGTQDPVARKALLDNPKVNVRVIFDPSYPYYAIIQPRLSRGGLIGTDVAWHFSAERYELERSPVSAMYDTVRSRRKWEGQWEVRLRVEAEGKGEVPAPYPRTEARYLTKVVLGRVSDEMLEAMKIGGS